MNEKWDKEFYARQKECADIRKANRLAQGLCQDCGKRPFIEGRKLCPECAERKRIYQQRKIAKRKEKELAEYAEQIPISKSKKKKSKYKTIEEIITLSRALGLSYGYYVSRIYEGKEER